MIFFFTETASFLIEVVAGSVGGTLMLLTIIVILVIFVHRRYTCTFKIGNVFIYFTTNQVIHGQLYWPWLTCHSLCFHINSVE